jgi:putative transposase
MQAVGRRYVPYFNRCRVRTGTLWERRYFAASIDSERYLLSCYRYIEQNPVRARMVQEPGAYAWSSHRANASGRHGPLVTPHIALTSLGTSAETRRSAYLALFDSAPSDAELETIRFATRYGRVLDDTSASSSDDES